MPIIINEVEVIAPPPSRAEAMTTQPINLAPAGPTPRDIYWVNRKHLERQTRLHTR